MKQGITIWLDVPLDALARRIAAVGTDSRPLLHHGSGDPYTKVANLSFEGRGKKNYLLDHHIYNLFVIIMVPKRDHLFLETRIHMLFI